MNNFAVHDNNRISRTMKTKKSSMSRVGKMPMSSKHTVTTSKKIGGMPEMGGKGPSKMMMRNKGVNPGIDAAGKSQLRKHGIKA